MAVDVYKLVDAGLGPFSQSKAPVELRTLKDQILIFVMCMKDLGLMKTESLISSLIHYQEVYLNGLKQDIERKVSDVIEAADYAQIEVKTAAEYHEFVEKYRIEIPSQHFSALPFYLPYSYMVKNINDILALAIGDIFKYWKNLMNDESDLMLFYASIDKLVSHAVDVLESRFIFTLKLTVI